MRTYDVYTDTYTFTAYTRSSRVSFTPLDPNWCRRMRIQSSPHTHRRLLSIFLELCWYMYIYIIYICINTYIHAHNISYIHIWCVHTWVNGWVLCYVSYIPNSWLLCGNVCLSKVPNIEFRWTRYRESEIAEPHYIILQYMLNCKDPRCWINRPQIDRVTRPGLFARLRILKVRLRCCRQLLGPWHSRVRI